MSDFSDRPLVAGSLIGFRTFRVDDGILTGISVRAPFMPGTNEAHCARRDRQHFRDLMPDGDYAYLVSLVEMQEMFEGISDVLVRMERGPAPRTLFGRRKNRVAEAPPHTVACKACACGFYAYTDLSGGARFVADPSEYLIRVGRYAQAIIEGFGACTVGSKGFRASKARLVALICPENPALDHYGVPTYPSRERAIAAHPLTTVGVSS